MQINLLEKGLTFVPTVPVMKQKKQLQSDLKEYHRRIILTTYFQEEQKNKYLPFRKKSDWLPRKSELPEEVHQLMRRDRKLLKKQFSYPQTEGRQNISMAEREGLNELIKNTQIVIKPADKGAMIVIMNKIKYCQEVYRQLNNEIYYKKLEAPIYKETIPMVKKILDKLEQGKIINKKQNMYLRGNVEPRERIFYILPKIHKDPSKWTVPFEIPPGRPIVSDCDSETYYTAEFIDYYLTPISMRHASYIKDTIHFLQIISNIKVPEQSFLFTMDVDNLYTNIDIPAGMRAVKEAFQVYPDPRRPDEEILQLLEINLTRNDFTFNSEYYLQIKGTAMGKKFAPAYANIFMANWEKEALEKCHIKPALYIRYLDDIFGIWLGNQEEFDSFVSILNKHDPSIKVKYELNEKSINFLDTTIYKGPGFLKENKLDTKVFFKPTDTHALLHKTSHHPKHIFSGILKSQLLRYQRICTQPGEFWRAVHILFRVLKKRGYSRSFLRKNLKEFKTVKNKDEGPMIPIITQYSTQNRKFHHELKNNFSFFFWKNKRMCKYRIISAYRKNRSLGDILVRARL